MYAKLALIVHLTHICAGQTSSQGFNILNQTLLSLNVSSGLDVRSVVNGNRLLLVWTQSNTAVFSMLNIYSWSEIASEQSLGLCESPEIEVVPGSNLFVIGCLTREEILFFLISESGFQAYHGSVLAQFPTGLRIFQLFDSKVAAVFTAQDGDGLGVYFLFLDRNGVVPGTQSRANTFIQGNQQQSVGIANGAGFVIAWNSYSPYSGIHIQHFTGAGVKTGPETVLFNGTGVMEFCRNLNGDWLTIYDTGRGNPGVFLTNIAAKDPILTAVHGLTPPIWRINRSFSSAVTTERFLLAVNYESPASVLCSQLLLFSPKGCFFASTSFCSSTGDQFISSVSVLESGLLVLVRDVSKQGVQAYYYSVPTASVCLETENDPNFPMWRGDGHIERTPPNVFIIATVLGGTFLLGIIAGTCVCYFRARGQKEEKLQRYQEQTYVTKNTSSVMLGSEATGEPT